MRRVDVDRMRRYRQRTRTRTPATILDNVTAWRYGRIAAFETEPDVEQRRAEVEERLREMGARTVEWTGPHEGIVST